MDVKDLMTVNTRRVLWTETLGNALRIIRQQSVYTLPVVNDNERLIGVLTLHTVWQNVGGMDEIAEKEATRFMQLGTEYAVRYTDDLGEAKRKMANYHLERIPVIDGNDRLMGELTLGQILDDPDQDPVAVRQLIKDVFNI
jgi:Mg/Co/Ni transporter MgtE